MKKLYKNAKVYTGELPLKEAFAVEDGRFIFAGSSEEGYALGADETEDLGGRFVCAGFNDSHMHLLGFGSALSMAPLAEHTASLGELLDCLREHAKAHPLREGQWLRGRGWNQDYFSDVSRMPNRWDLDRVSKDHPIAITRCCGHAMAVNSKALELCGIDASTPSPEGGRIGMKDGEPDGLFYDGAMPLIVNNIPLPGKEEVKDMIRSACRALNGYGITSVQSDDFSAFRGLPWETVIGAYKELEASGELTVRVYEQCNLTEVDDFKRFTAAGNSARSGSDMFRIGPLKLLGDGSLGARTAYLSRPYADDPSGRGFPIFTQEQLDALTECANESGFQFAVHAIGDACLDMVLDAAEKALEKHPRADHRHGIVHCQISRPDQLERIAKLKMHVYAQSIFLDYDTKIVKERAGEELASSSYSWKTLMDKGVCVSNGSDCPVELPDVMKGIQCAVTRRSCSGGEVYLKEEAFTVEEALDSFTRNAARASFDEDIKGRIVPGMLADFTLLSEDPFEADPDHIKEIEILGAWLGGEKVFG
ncbi:MAG: amidohydrolase [Firmicutes bacterium]|nr:amidohydrolase [Bacillota bacterium]